MNKRTIEKNVAEARRIIDSVGSLLEDDYLYGSLFILERLNRHTNALIQDISDQIREE
jgi:hypothetical protein|tara:strand:- start:498 stop:671 length:174 start_codon:yes stop_codon:yes gene_type:complete